MGTRSFREKYLELRKVSNVRLFMYITYYFCKKYRVAQRNIIRIKNQLNCCNLVQIVIICIYKNKYTI